MFVLMLSLFFPEVKDISPLLVSRIKGDFSNVTCGDMKRDLIALLDPVNSRCYVYKNGAELSAFGGEGSAPGEFNFMHGGGVKIVGENQIYIYDPGNFRVQVFTLEGKFKNSISVSVVSSDFEIDHEHIYFSPIMGDRELVIMGMDGKKVKEITGRNIDFMKDKFPYPLKKMAVSDKYVYYGFLDEKKFKIYSKAEGKVIKEVSFNVKPVKISDELRKKMEEQAPQLKDRIRKYQYPWVEILFDPELKRVLVRLSTEDSKKILFDAFSEDGRFIKRVGLNGVKGTPLATYNGKILTFFPDSSCVYVYDCGKM